MTVTNLDLISSGCGTNNQGGNLIPRSNILEQVAPCHERKFKSCGKQATRIYRKLLCPSRPDPLSWFLFGLCFGSVLVWVSFRFFFQDRAWKDTTVSVFDLENMEEEGQLRGEEMPWANDK